MFHSLFESLKKMQANKSEPETKEDKIARRRYSRRDVDRCVSVINNRTYPVVNWSLGGLQIMGDDRLFAVDDTFDVILKFKLSDRILEVPHKARVVRAHNNRVAFQFMPLTKDIRDNFQNVVDDYVSRQFAESQMA